MNELEKIEWALDHKDLQLAYDLCHSALKKSNNPPLLKLMSRVYAEAGETMAAGNALLKCINDFGFDPNIAIDCSALFQSSMTNQVTSIRLCRNCLNHISKISENNLNKLATLLIQHDLIKEALKVLEFASKNYAFNKESAFNLANCYKFTGDFKSCDQMLRAIIRKDREYYKAYSTMVSLPTNSFDNKDLHQVLESIENCSDYKDKQHLYYTLYLFHERKKDFSKAFYYLKAANEAEKSVIGNIKTDLDASYRNAIRLFQDMPIENSLRTNKTRAPIFVVGLPRTGTTLTARLLSAHPDVQDAGERPFLNICMSPMLNKSGKMSLTEQLVSSPLEEIVNSYLLHISEIIGSSIRFVDQKPTNYNLIGFICLLIPNAKIIEVIRNPMDTCFSNYRQFFNRSVAGLQYTCDFEEIIRHFSHYKELMDFWQQKFPNKIYRVSYESLVKNPLKETARLYRACDLEFNQEYVQIEKQTSAVSTASSTQLREPVHTKYIERWKNYSTYLDKYIANLPN